MKIAMIGQKGMPARYGGVERHVHDLSVRLAASGHEVIAYSRSWYTGMQDGEIEGVQIVHTKSIHTKHLDAISHTLTSIFSAIKNRVDVIHFHGVGPSLLSWIPRIFAPRIRVITTFHSIDRYHEKWNWLAKLFLRFGERTACTFSHRTIAVSRSLQQYCLNEFGKEVDYIPNAVPVEYEEIGNEHLATFNLEKDNYLVMISRLIPHKGAHLLVEAFTNVKQAFKNDERVKNLKLAIVGGSVYTDKYVQLLHRQATACNDIVFTDFQSGRTLDELYKNARALVHPSMNEGLPITVMQAMSHKTPVLVSNIPEHIELVHDVRSVFVENNVQALEQAIVNFLNLNSEEVTELANDNYQTILKHYSWDSVVPQIVKLYEGDTERIGAIVEGIA